MRQVLLGKAGLNKLRASHKELKFSDFDEPLRVTPGEWCVFKHRDAPEAWIGFANPLVSEKFPQVHIVSTAAPGDEKQPFEYIESLVRTAYQSRLLFKEYEHGCRAFYGASDGLPGLIIDTFSEAAIIQINTAGIDTFREKLRDLCETIYKKKCYFLDNEKYRQKESLPMHPKEEIPDLLVQENGLKLRVRKEVLQKVGFYYDHRENRYQLITHLGRINRNFETGIDLFSYVGAWGLSALRSKVGHVDFVDQGDFETDLTQGLELNGFSGRGRYHRTDVFRFIDDLIQKSKKYDLVMCDPPAFAKTALQKKDALEGYSKLHRKVFRIAGAKSLVAFSSCTHYVDHDEFQKNISEAASKEKRKIQLIYAGMQGWDHPVPSLADRSNYIKCYFYIVE